MVWSISNFRPANSVNGAVDLLRAEHCEIEALAPTTSTLEEVFVRTVEIKTVMVTIALIRDTFREALARKIFWVLFGLSTLLILFFLFLLRIDIVAGAIATVSLFGRETGSNPRRGPPGARRLRRNRDVPLHLGNVSRGVRLGRPGSQRP